MEVQGERNFYSWLAGFFDGEGNVQIRENKDKRGYISWTVRLMIDNTNQVSICYIRDTLGYGRTGIHRKKTDKTRTSYYFSVCGQEAVRLAKILSCFCVIKKEQLDLVIRYGGLGSCYNGATANFVINERRKIAEKLREVINR